MVIVVVGTVPREAVLFPFSLSHTAKTKRDIEKEGSHLAPQDSLSPPGPCYLFSRISESEAINLRCAASVERVRATSGCVAPPTSLCS